MKLTQLLLTGCGILAVNYVIVSPVLAQCVQADAGVQVDTSAGRANQTYDRNMQQNGPCTGNTSVTTGTQVNTTGRGNNEQRRQVNHTMTGGSGNGTGINGPTVQGGANVQLDVDNPADGYNPKIKSP